MIYITLIYGCTVYEVYSDYKVPCDILLELFIFVFILHAGESTLAGLKGDKAHAAKCKRPLRWVSCEQKLGSIPCRDSREECAARASGTRNANAEAAG